MGTKIFLDGDRKSGSKLNYRVEADQPPSVEKARARFVLYRKYVRPFPIVPADLVDFFFAAWLVHTSRPRADRRVSKNPPMESFPT